MQLDFNCVCCQSRWLSQSIRCDIGHVWHNYLGKTLLHPEIHLDTHMYIYISSSERNTRVWLVFTQVNMLNVSVDETVLM